MAKFYPMFSGSDGNCTYIGNSSGGVLVDAGVSYKRIKNGLLEAGLSSEDVKAVLITHEHNDHIKGLKIFLKNLVSSYRETRHSSLYSESLFISTQ